jgi:hypothetical protein
MATILALVAFAATAWAGMIDIDDFESVDASAGATSPDSSIWNEEIFSGGNNVLEVIQDTNNLFGAGTDNQILHLVDDSDGEKVTLYANSVLGSTDLVTLSFDLYEPDTLTGGKLYVRMRDEGERSVDARFSDGIAKDNAETVTGSYGQDAPVKISIVANDTGSSVNYAGVSVADGTYDIWAGNARIIAGGSFRDKDGSVFNDLEIGMFTSDSSEEMYLDNIAVENGAIPEPATMSLLALGGLVAIRRRSCQAKR